MVFPITLPAPTNVVNVQIWDRDLLSFNDYLGDASFTFNELAKMAWERKARMKRYGESDSFMDRVKDKSTEKFVIKC